MEKPARIARILFFKTRSVGHMISIYTGLGPRGHTVLLAAVLVLVLQSGKGKTISMRARLLPTPHPIKFKCWAWKTALITPLAVLLVSGTCQALLKIAMETR